MSVSPEILKQVKAIELRTRGLVGTLFAGEYRSVFRGQGMEFAEVRAYEAGDDFRSIDWNVSARLASPYVKTFTEERELTLMLLVDQSGSTRFGEPLTKAALAVEVAAVPTSFPRTSARSRPTCSATASCSPSRPRPRTSPRTTW